MECRPIQETAIVAQPSFQSRWIPTVVTNLFERMGSWWGGAAKISPKRILSENGLIAEKLQRQFAYAQTQAAEEWDKAFRDLAAPKDFSAEVLDDGDAGICHCIGRRPTMEDQHLATVFDLVIQEKTYPVRLYGIFDGHGGDKASLFVKKNLQRVLSETLHECSNVGDAAIWKALKTTFVRLNEEFGKHSSGTTATVAMILNGKIWVANTGDSRTILDDGTALSEDAKPTNPRYRKGIEKRGGFVFYGRVNGILAVARAIGDFFVGAVNPRPKIICYPLPKKATHLILACDGIYDVASTRQVAAAVRAHHTLSASEIAKNIVYSAYKAGSTDNLSTLVVKLANLAGTDTMQE